MTVVAVTAAVAVATAAVAVAIADRSGCVQCCRIYKFAAPQKLSVDLIKKGLCALEE